MALFRKLFYRKPPDGLLEISERVYVFDCCFTTEVWDEENYKGYVGGVISELREHYPDASILVFNFRDAEWESRIANALSEYDMTIMDYPRHYEGCPLLPMEVIHHFLRSSESWLSLGQQNLLVMHCERGGWAVLAFMLAALLIYRKQYSGEQKILDMVYKQAPRELLHLLSPLNPLPSQLRYLQYISRRNLVSQWPPLDRALSLDCVIIRMIPNIDGHGGCRPIFRIYGPDPSLVGDRSPKVLFSTPKRSKAVRHYKQAECELVKIDINCRIQGDVVLECISLYDDMEREKMIFRAMFNTAFIRSNILMLNRDEIDILWDAKDQFPKDFRAEVLFSEMDAAASVVPMDTSCFEEKEGLPVEAFAKVNEIFNSVDWLVPKAEAALSVIQQVAAANVALEKLAPHITVTTLAKEGANEKLQEKGKSVAFEEIGKSSSHLVEKEQSVETALSVTSLPSSLVSPDDLSKSQLTHVSSQSEPCINLEESSNATIVPTFSVAETASTKFITSPQHPKDAPVNYIKPPSPAPVPPPPPVFPPLMDKTASRTSTVMAGTATPLSLAAPLQKPLAPTTPEMKDKAQRIKSPPSEVPNIASSLTENVAQRIVVSPPPTLPTTSLIENASFGTESHTQPSSPRQLSFASLPENEVGRIGSHSPPPPVPSHPQLASSFTEIAVDRAGPPAPSPPTLLPSTASLNEGSSLKVGPPPPPPPPAPMLRENSISPFEASQTRPSLAPPLKHISAFTGGSIPAQPPPPPPVPTLRENSTSTPGVPQPPPPAVPPLKDNSAFIIGSIPPPPPPPPTPSLRENSTSASGAPQPPPPPAPPLKENSAFTGGNIPPPPAPSLREQSTSTSGAPQPPPLKENSASTGGSIPPPPPPPFSPMKESSAPRGGPPPPPPPPLHPGPASGHSSSSVTPPPPPPPIMSVPAKNSSSSIPSAPPPPMPSKENIKKPGSVVAGGGGNLPVSPPPPSAPLPGAKGRSMLSRTIASRSNQTKKLKPLHWLKLTRAVQGSLWAETQKSGEAVKAPDIDISELESLFSAAVPNSDHGSSGRKGNSRASLGHKAEKVQLIEHRRAYNCEIMLSKVKIPLPDLLSMVLALEDSALDVDQVENLIKFCPTKEEMELLKGYKGEKDKLGKCEQFFLEMMQVPRIEPKLRVFSFKIQFRSQVSELQRNLNIVNSAADQIRNSAKLKRIMQTILSLGNALNQGTARGSAVGFRLDSLLKLTETRARNNKMTLMHYLCKVLADKLPELLDFSKDLSSLEPASKIQLKVLAEEMQAISKGLEKVIQELSMSENDGPVSENFCKALKEFLSCAEGEVRSLASLYSGVGRNVDALIIYFGEDPSRCPFEQVISTILNFVRMFNQAHIENCKQLEFERKKAEKEAAAAKLKLDASEKGTEHVIPPTIRS